MKYVDNRLEDFNRMLVLLLEPLASSGLGWLLLSGLDLLIRYGRLQSKHVGITLCVAIVRPLEVAREPKVPQEPQLAIPRQEGVDDDEDVRWVEEVFTESLSRGVVL